MIEREYKYRCSNLNYVKNMLKDRGYRYIAMEIEEDIYYQHPCRNFASTDEALRLRRVRGSKNKSIKRIELTYKGPRLPGDAKAREEITINIPAQQCPQIEDMLQRLGFKQVAVVRKRRSIYRKKPVIVFLDRVEKLGDFVEVELAEHSNEDHKDLKEITNFLQTHCSIENKTYLELLLEEKGKPI